MITKSKSMSFEVSGYSGLFTQPVTKFSEEKLTYMIPSYEALKGMTKNIYWKPEIEPVIEKLRVMNDCSCIEVQTERLIGSKGNVDITDNTILIDCRYQVLFHFEKVSNSYGLSDYEFFRKHEEIYSRFIDLGGKLPVFLGTRDHRGFVVPCEFNEGAGYYDHFGVKHLGKIYHGITYPNQQTDSRYKGKRTARIFDAEMVDGIIEFPRPEECEVVGFIHMDKKQINKGEN